jgi:hypothetical protein
LRPRWTEIRRDEGDERGFETHQNLVEEVLDELLLKWSGSKETMKIGAEQLSDEISGATV